MIELYALHITAYVRILVHSLQLQVWNVCDASYTNTIWWRVQNSFTHEKRFIICSWLWLLFNFQCVLSVTIISVWYSSSTSNTAFDSDFRIALAVANLLAKLVANKKIWCRPPIQVLTQARSRASFRRHFKAARTFLPLLCESRAGAEEEVIYCITILRRESEKVKCACAAH